MSIFQGGKQLNKEDFKSHLHSLCQLDNVGVLLGAGSSVGCGGHTMKQVWQRFKESDPQYVSLLISDYFLVTKEKSDADDVNVELLIDEVSKFHSVAKIRKAKEEEKVFDAILKALYKIVTQAALLVGQDFSEKTKARAMPLIHIKSLLQN